MSHGAAGAPGSGRRPARSRVTDVGVGLSPRVAVLQGRPALSSPPPVSAGREYRASIVALSRTGRRQPRGSTWPVARASIADRLPRKRQLAGRHPSCRARRLQNEPNSSEHVACQMHTTRLGSRLCGPFVPCPLPTRADLWRSAAICGSPSAVSFAVAWTARRPSPRTPWSPFVVRPPIRRDPCRSVGITWFTSRRVPRRRRGCSPVPLVVPVCRWPDRWRSVAICGSRLAVGAVVPLVLRRPSAQICEICGPRRSLCPSFCRTNPMRQNTPFGERIRPASEAVSAGRSFWSQPVGIWANLCHLRIARCSVAGLLQNEPNGPPALAEARLRNEPNERTALFDNRTQRPSRASTRALPAVCRPVQGGGPWPRLSREPDGGHWRDRGVGVQAFPAVANDEGAPHPGEPLPGPARTGVGLRSRTRLRDEPNRRRARRHRERGHRADRGISPIRPGEAVRPQEALRGTNRMRHKVLSHKGDTQNPADGVPPSGGGDPEPPTGVRAALRNEPNEHPMLFDNGMQRGSLTTAL
jgi:hypothetical protein